MTDISLDGLIAHLAGFELRLDHEAHEGLERASVVVETEAKRAIGHDEYMPGGPFLSPWPDLAESTIQEKERLGYFGQVSEHDTLLRTGEMRDSIGHEVGHMEAVVGSNSDVAVYQELGTASIPPRSFLGGAAVQKAERVAEILGASATQALVGGFYRVPIPKP